MEYARKVRLFLTSAVLLIASCSSTTFTAVWKDASYQTQPQKIMVVDTSQGLADRRLFEDEFVRSVKKHGADAIPSYPVMQNISRVDQKSVDAQAEALGADAVLTSRVTGYEANTWEAPWALYRDIYTDVQTSLYEVKTHRLIWTATTRTWQRDDMKDMYGIRSVVRRITNKMALEGLLKPEAPDVADREGAKD
ncbi:MAG TPA: hypothetical protein VL197_08070 [Nitrospirota bacterium]|nr:hypothetical protein [Nitrospirota bacterium]